MKLSVEAWARDYVDVVPRGQPQAAAAAAAAGQPQAASLANLQALYTKHVIPDALLQLWRPAACGTVQTLLREGEDMAAGRQRVLHDWLTYIATRLLHVDTHPTLSRLLVCSEGLATLPHSRCRPSIQGVSSRD